MQVLRYLPWTLYFNFHYLPIKQAIKLPILLYKPKLRKCGGCIKIEGTIRPGMIKLGFNQFSIYPNTGIMWENSGSVVFNGWSAIGNNSYLSIGNTGKLIIGNGFRATASLKIACYNQTTIGNNVLLGWDCTIMDSDFHSATRTNGTKTIGTGPIKIGNDNWFGTQVLCLKDTTTPNFAIVAARSILNKDYLAEGEKILIAGQPAKICKTGIYHDNMDDSIAY